MLETLAQATVIGKALLPEEAMDHLAQDYGTAPVGELPSEVVVGVPGEIGLGANTEQSQGSDPLGIGAGIEQPDKAAGAMARKVKIAGLGLGLEKPPHETMESLHGFL